MSYLKPVPVPNQWTKPFWDACNEKRLIAQRCDATGQVWFPPAPTSPNTRDDKWTWVDLSGKGKVASFVVMHQKYFPGYDDDMPYKVIEVELEEGIILISNIVELGDRELEIGMEVEVVFEPAGEEFLLPKFRPVA